MRNPRDEAYDRVAHRYEARVLEPSPPAVKEPPWFADDPVARGELRPQPVDGVDEDAARCLADWYGFAASVLEQLRAEAPAELEPSRVQLWPEHFDMSVELGPEAAGQRAGFGCSPGDAQHPEP